MEEETKEEKEFEEEISVNSEIHVGYTIHSMLHSAIVDMDPTKLHMLERFEKTQGGGHKYTPKNSNAKLIISGRDWSNKNINIYGSKSTKEADNHLKSVEKKVDDIGHRFSVKQHAKISNLAINGDLGQSIQLEELSMALSQEDYETSYEPEQFPGLKIVLPEPSCTFLIFASGAFVLQGLNAKSDIENAVKNMVELLIKKDFL